MVETDTHVFILEFKVDKSGGVRAVGILTQGTRSSGAGFRRVSSAGIFRGVNVVYLQINKSTCPKSYLLDFRIFAKSLKVITNIFIKPNIFTP